MPGRGVALAGMHLKGLLWLRGGAWPLWGRDIGREPSGGPDQAGASKGGRNGQIQDDRKWGCVRSEFGASAAKRGKVSGNNHYVYETQN